jgi:hypothetical protein
MASCGCDKCQDYIRRDTKITTILDQCRKLRIATTLADQKVLHLTPAVAAAVLDVAIQMMNVEGEADILAKECERRRALSIAPTDVSSFSCRRHVANLHVVDHALSDWRV